MRVLELFSGTGNLSRIARERGHDTFTIDLDQPADANLDIYALSANDVLSLTGWDGVDVVWASPPCTGFSVATIGRSWENLGGGVYRPKSDAARESLALLTHTMTLIKGLAPAAWYVENPRGMARKMPGMRQHPRRTVTYCQYGESRMKPTDIWTNNPHWQSRPACSNGDPCHEAAPRGSRTGTQGERSVKIRARLPDELCLEVIEAAEAMLGSHERH